MNIDTDLIKHWANIFESEECTLRDIVKEDTLDGFTVEDIQPIVANINKKLKENKSNCVASISGKGPDWTVVLKNTYERPNYDTEYYSADGADDAWYEGVSEDLEFAKRVIFDEFKKYFSGEDFEKTMEFVYTDDGQKFVPKRKAKKLIDDAIRNLVDSEWNQIRKLPQEKREKYFMLHSFPRLALMGRQNRKYIDNPSEQMESCVRSLLDKAETIGSYGTEDFIKLLGSDVDFTYKRGSNKLSSKQNDDIHKEFRNASEGLEGENVETHTEAMSIDDILKKGEEIKAKRDAERAEEQVKKEQGDVKSVTITDVGEDGTIKYVIERKDGSKEDYTQEGNFDESEIRKMERTLKQMSGRTPDDKDIYVALFRSYMSSGAKTPIKWYYEFGRSRGELDNNWFYSPSEDYLGHTPDFVQSLHDNGWSRGI